MRVDVQKFADLNQWSWIYPEFLDNRNQPTDVPVADCPFRKGDVVVVKKGVKKNNNIAVVLGTICPDGDMRLDLCGMTYWGDCRLATPEEVQKSPQWSKIEQSFMSNYEIRMSNWEIEEDRDCENYQLAKAWAIQNGYSLVKDISYNGYIYLEKKFNLTEDPSDGNKIELQVYCYDRFHNWQQYDMEPDFGSIMDETKWRFKPSKGSDTSGANKNLQTLLNQVLEREKSLIQP